MLEGLLLFHQNWTSVVYLLIPALLFFVFLYGFLRDLNTYGVKTELDISRVLGKDAKEALSFGDVGILTYNNEYIVTWASPFFSEKGIDLVNKKMTSWIEEIRDLFDDDVDLITGRDGQRVYEITRKSDAQLLFVKDVTELSTLRNEVDEQRGCYRISTVG